MVEKPNGGGNMSEERKQPVKKVKCGRISVSVWRHKATSTNGAAVERQRVCVQHSRKDRSTGDWHNQQIWLNIDELRDLANALDQLNEVGESSSSSAKGTTRDFASQPSGEGNP